MGQEFFVRKALLVAVGFAACDPSVEPERLGAARGPRSPAPGVRLSDDTASETAIGEARLFDDSGPAGLQSVLSVACDPLAGRLYLYNQRIVEPGLRIIDGHPVPRFSPRRLAPGDPPVDCDVPDHHLRMKLGEGPGLPAGYCGGDPPLFVSVWVDGIKVIAARNYSGGCMQYSAPLANLSVSANETEWCTASAERGEVLRDKAFACESRTFDLEGKAVDRVEFPLPGAEIFEVGTITLDHAVDAALCGSMIVPDRSREGAPRWRLELPPDSERELFQVRNADLLGAHEIGLGEFDLDNDGVTDNVYWNRWWAGPFTGDEFFVVDDAIAAKEPETIDERFLRLVRSENRLSLPGAWATEESGAAYRIKHLNWDQAGSLGAAKIDGASSPAWARNPILHFGSLYFRVFRRGEQTYFLTEPPDWGAEFEDTFVVLRPRPKAVPEEICVFHKVLQNF